MICILLSRLIQYYACCYLMTSSRVDLWNTKWIIIVVIIIIIIIIELFTSHLWLGNIPLSCDAVINRIWLSGLTCSLKSFLKLNMCQELQIFAVVYMYWGAG